MPAHLLVVDDNELNRDMLSRRLTRAGYVVTCSPDGPDSLNLVQAQQFDLVLLDVMMPVMDGLEVLTRLRQQYSVTDLPVVMVTARTEPDQIVEALKLGANDYVVKPINFPVVLARVQTQLSLKDSSDQVKSLATELEQRNQFIRHTFGRYVSNEIVQTVLDNPEGLSFDGEHRVVSALFADLRGFTLLADTLEPQVIVRLLNNYLESMIDVIHSSGGTVAEIVGDGLLAFFGAPIADDDHAEKAVRCAIAMQGTMKMVNEKNRADGLVSVQMGIGINSGEGVLGNIGSASRAKYAVVGSVVNLASRIESVTAGGQIYIADSTREMLGPQISLGQQRNLNPKGSTEPMTIHEVVGADSGDISLRIEINNMKTMTPALQVQYSMVSDKHVGQQAFAGRIDRLTHTACRLTTSESLEPHAELKITLDVPSLADTQVFGRIIELPEESTALIQFSSLTPAIQRLFDTLTSSDAASE